MEFKARAPRDGVNVSKTHPLKEASTLIAGLVAVMVGLVLVAAWSVEIAVRFISPEAEARAFSSANLDSLVEEIGQLQEEHRRDVQRLLDQLLAHWEDAAYDFKVLVVDSGDANAAALPGGYIVVTSGLIEEVESENELAFVLGHELGHFHNRDHLRRLGRAVVYSLALGIVFGSSGTSVPDLGGLAGNLTSRGFDRRQESEADRFGLSLVQAEYGHIGSSWQFFHRLSEAAGELEDLVAYLSTHPASSARIEELRRYAEQQGWPLEGEVRPFEPRKPAVEESPNP